MASWLKACLNGARRPADHPALPTSAAQVAADVVAVAGLGVRVVHVHPKDVAGVDTLDAAALEDLLDAVRRAAPDVAVGVTTGAWAAPDPHDRVAAVRSWTSTPDFASVNWHEDGADDVARTLLDAGIAVEAGIWDDTGLRAWQVSAYRRACVRVLVEVPDVVPVEAERIADELVMGVGDELPVVLHGEGLSCWPVLRHAAGLGLGTRIGLEDTLVLPDGSPAPGNAALVQAARAILG